MFIRFKKLPLRKLSASDRMLGSFSFARRENSDYRRCSNACPLINASSLCYYVASLEHTWFGHSYSRDTQKRSHREERATEDVIVGSSV